MACGRARRWWDIVWDLEQSAGIGRCGGVVYDEITILRLFI